LRYKQLREWLFDMQPPAVLYLGKLFNPKAFLSGLCMLAARRLELPLDEMTLTSTVTDKVGNEVQRDGEHRGTFVAGLYMQGGRWSMAENALVDSPDKELVFEMPPVLLEAVHISEARELHAQSYECPVYYTAQRGATFVFSLHLKHKAKAATSMEWASVADTWAFRGVACSLCDPDS
jgi:hypothetical protein